ncbi:efflux RND transporter permease subunit [Natronospirillum operosum]|uniref:Efflux RND transporter permease subunit n=1 Tax=Natronospirillum operosum TaxID=2759953 RepID=A0A4Z0WG97_9GAMM|nr:efflux RND transporter permease subunit [Natronospirillum operosum]TGG94246.1 efflux RND transporter permease subunit [Natronospirillum operosum]
MSSTPRIARMGGFTALFVRRPVLALVVSALIVVAGLAGLAGVEVRELPEVDNPVITITTSYTGAAPETVDREITSVLEGTVARVSGINSISSSSNFGRSRITMEFCSDTNLDTAATDIRDAISRIINRLPDGADEPRIVKADADAQPIIRLSVTADHLSVQQLTQILEDDVVDRLAAVPGVADVQNFGARNEIFRVDVDPSRLAAYGLTIADLQQALNNVSFDAPAGSLSSADQSLVVRTTSQVSTPEEFEALQLRPRVRLGDVANVTLGDNPSDSVLRTNGRVGVGVGIVRQAQSNTLEISNGVRTAVDDIQAVLPEGVRIQVTSDDATFIRGSIEEALKTLLLAVSIVTLMIFVFLRDWRATLIPAITIPVALVGTMAAIYLAGFSVNILTLLALVLATGMVVDDTIVVLENIVRKRNQGMGPRAAAVLGVQQVFFAVVTTTATLAAVFIPLSFLPGQAGGLFREFGFTLALAVVLSSIVALTLCPMLSSRLLRAAPANGTDENGTPAPRGLFDLVGDLLAAFYQRLLRACLAAPMVSVAVALMFGAFAVSLFGSIENELTPEEDRSVALLSISAPQGVSLDYTDRQVRQIEALLQPLQDNGEIANTFTIAGFGASPNRAFMVMTLPPKSERARSQQDIVGEINGLLSTVPGVQAFAIQPNSLGIRGGGQGLRFALTGSSYEALSEVADDLVGQMQQDPRFGRVNLSFETTQPQLGINIDRARANDLGIQINGLAGTLQAMLEGNTVGSVFIEDRSFDIRLLTTSQPVRDPSDLQNLFVRTDDGRMVPMSTIVELEERAVSPSLNREGQMRAIAITASLADGFALGEALAEAQSLANPLLADNMRILPLGEAAALDETGNALLITFGFAMLVVFLVLAAQFESFVSAFIVMFTVPFGLACAVFALLLTGVSLNIYSQIGLVLLVGIMAKNGILMVEFANQLRDRGRSVREAIEEAAIIRLRPVMMTMSSTVLGGLPLILSTGPGAEAREALGWVIVMGLGLASVFTLFLTPVAYLLIARFATTSGEEQARLEAELAEVSDAPA